MYEEIVFPKKKNKKEIELLVPYRGKRDFKIQRKENNRIDFAAWGSERLFLFKVEGGE